jgi:hypothetical protein
MAIETPTQDDRLDALLSKSRTVHLDASEKAELRALCEARTGPWSPPSQHGDGDVDHSKGAFVGLLGGLW